MASGSNSLRLFGVTISDSFWINGNDTVNTTATNISTIQFNFTVESGVLVAGGIYNFTAEATINSSNPVNMLVFPSQENKGLVPINFTNGSPMWINTTLSSVTINPSNTSNLLNNTSIMLNFTLTANDMPGNWTMFAFANVTGNNYSNNITIEIYTSSLIPDSPPTVLTSPNQSWYRMNQTVLLNTTVTDLDNEEVNLTGNFTLNNVTNTSQIVKFSTNTSVGKSVNYTIGPLNAGDNITFRYYSQNNLSSAIAETNITIDVAPYCTTPLFNQSTYSVGQNISVNTTCTDAPAPTVENMNVSWWFNISGIVRLNGTLAANSGDLINLTFSNFTDGETITAGVQPFTKQPGNVYVSSTTLGNPLSLIFNTINGNQTYEWGSNATVQVLTTNNQLHWCLHVGRDDNITCNTGNQTIYYSLNSIKWVYFLGGNTSQNVTGNGSVRVDFSEARNRTIDSASISLKQAAGTIRNVVIKTGSVIHEVVQAKIVGIEYLKDNWWNETTGNVTITFGRVGTETFQMNLSERNALAGNFKITGLVSDPLPLNYTMNFKTFDSNSTYPSLFTTSFVLWDNYYRDYGTSKYATILDAADFNGVNLTIRKYEMLNSGDCGDSEKNGFITSSLNLEGVDNITFQWESTGYTACQIVTPGPFCSAVQVNFSAGIANDDGSQYTEFFHSLGGCNSCGVGGTHVASNETVTLSRNRDYNGSGVNFTVTSSATQAGGAYNSFVASTNGSYELAFKMFNDNVCGQSTSYAVSTNRMWLKWVNITGITPPVTINGTWNTTLNYTSKAIFNSTKNITKARLNLDIVNLRDQVVRLFLSNGPNAGGGTDYFWEPTVNNEWLYFRGNGSQIAFRIEIIHNSTNPINLSYNTTEWPVYIRKVNVTVQTGSPKDINFDFGGDGIIDLHLNDTLNESNSPITLPINSTIASRINSLANSTCGVNYTSCMLLVDVSSNNTGTLILSDLNLSIDRRNYRLNSTYLQQMCYASNPACQLEFNFTSLGGGVLEITNLTIYQRGYQVLTFNVTANTTFEGTSSQFCAWRNITINYSRTNITMPVPYFDFIPSSASSKNVEPEGQEAKINRSIFNITHLGVDGKANMFGYFNETLNTCLKMYCSISSNKTGLVVVANTTRQMMASNMTRNGLTQVYCWMNFTSCTAGSLYLPDFFIEPNCDGCVEAWNG